MQELTLDQVEAVSGGINIGGSYPVDQSREFQLMWEELLRQFEQQP